MNKKAILVTSASVGAVVGAFFFAKKKGWNPVSKFWHKSPEANNGQPRAGRKAKAA